MPPMSRAYCPLSSPAAPARLAPLVAGLVALLALSACGGSSSGGDPEPEVNQAPTLAPPIGLAGTGASFTLTLATTGTDSLLFTASDPEGDTLSWSILGAGSTAASVGMTAPGPTIGTTFQLDFATVTAPASLAIVLVVEDTSGNASAVDLLIVRSGTPTLTGVTPSSAFVNASQPVTISGTAFSLGGQAATTVRFAGTLGQFTTIVNDTTIATQTPTGLTAGPIAITAANQFGTAALPSSEFTAYRNPPIFQTSDTPLDTATGSALHLARDGSAIHAVFLEGGAVIHRGSADAGVTWSAPLTLSGAETPTEPRVAVTGTNVTVVWLGDGTSVQSRSSSDGGSSFDPAVVVNPTAGATPAAQLQISASADRRYAAWRAGDVGLAQGRIAVAGSTDAGATWAAPVTVDGGAGSGQQSAPAIDCEGAVVWVAFTDDRQGAGIFGTYTARSTDAGVTWSMPGLRSSPGVAVQDPMLQSGGDGRNVHAAWLQGGQLRYAASTDGGGGWAPAITLQDASGGAVTSPSIACDEQRIFAAYVVNGNSVWVAAVTATGSLPTRTQVDDTTMTVAGTTTIHHDGSYVFAGWRSGDLPSNAGRIVHVVSTDTGQTFSTPVNVGSGTNSQSSPQIIADGASILFGWTGGVLGNFLFVNRNEP